MAGITEYKYKEQDFTVTKEIKDAFEKDGIVIIRNLLNGNELNALKDFLEQDPTFTTKTVARDDGQGTKANMCVWNHPGDDMTGLLMRSHKVVNTIETLLGGEVYHYHTKLILKDAHSGGAFLWHQDYGYWYENGCLFPDMGTMFLAVDRADRDNGCLQVLLGSHKMGRVDHVASAGQVTADPERVKEVQKVCRQVHLELHPGDAAFFHCNLLHCSAQNLTARRRWALLASYNRASNNPYLVHHHPQYTPLIKVPNSAILTGGKTINSESKNFLDDVFADDKFNNEAAGKLDVILSKETGKDKS